MALFGHNTNTNILLAIEYINVLLQSNHGLETIFVKVGEKNFFGVSPVFARVIKKVQKGKSMKEVLQSEKNKTKNKNMKKLLDLLDVSEGMNLQPLLIDLSNDVMDRKEFGMDNLLENLGAGLSKIMALISFPIIIFFAYMAQEASQNLGINITPFLAFVPYILAADLVLVFIVLFGMGVKG